MKGEHDETQTSSITKIPGRRNAYSAEDLYRWITDRMKGHARLKRKLVFPEVNIDHESEETKTRQNYQESNLQKRYQEVIEKETEARIRIKQLLEDNMKLRNSSQSWCLKYQDLLSQQEQDTISSFYFTPKKVIKTNYIDELLTL